MGCGAPSSNKTNPTMTASSPSPLGKLKTVVLAVVPQTGPINDPILQQKLASITRITDWYNQVNGYLTAHVTLSDGIVGKLDKTIKSTSKGVENLIDFFKERAHREEDSAKNKESLTSCFKEGTNNMFPNLTKLLQEIDNYHSQKAESLKALAEYIEHDVVKETFKKSLAAFEKKMETFKDKIHDLKKDVKSLLKEAQIKFAKYYKLYQDFVQAYQDPTNSKPPKGDFYFFELQFLKSMQTTQDKAQELGKLTVQYWSASKTNQSALFESLKTGLTNYLTKAHEIHGDTGSGKKDGGPINLQSAIGLLESFVPGAEILQHFDIGKICDEIKMADQVISIFKKPITGEDDMKGFFEDQEIPLDQSQKPLVKKEYEMMRDTGTLLKDFKDCVIYITVDNNLVVIDGKKEEVFGKEPKYCMALENVTITQRKDANLSLFDVVEKGGSKMLIDDTLTCKIEEIKGFLKKTDADQQAAAGNN